MKTFGKEGGSERNFSVDHEIAWKIRELTKGKKLKEMSEELFGEIMSVKKGVGKTLRGYDFRLGKDRRAFEVPLESVKKNPYFNLGEFIAIEEDENGNEVEKFYIGHPNGVVDKDNNDETAWKIFDLMGSELKTSSDIDSVALDGIMSVKEGVFRKEDGDYYVIDPWKKEYKFPMQALEKNIFSTVGYCSVIKEDPVNDGKFISSFGRCYSDGDFVEYPYDLALEIMEDSFSDDVFWMSIN